MKSNYFRVLACEWAHETNTFSIVPTNLTSFKKMCFYDTHQDIVQARRGTKTELGATFEAAEKYGWEIVSTIIANANPSGRLTTDSYEYLVEKILLKVRGNQIYDGVMLHLHGAMVSEEYEDCEGELLKRLRSCIGDSIPIIVTLDLHGNITPLMANMASALIAVRTYPHIDFYEMSIKANELLQLQMNGTIKLKTVISKRPTLMGLDGGKTQQGPMRVLLDRADEIERLEASKGVMVVSICAGFTAADIYDIGPSVTVTVNLLASNDADAVINNAQSIAESFMDYVWETRAYSSTEHKTIDEAIQYAEKFIVETNQSQSNEHSHGPLIIADVSDNPGSGHYGDSTAFLSALIGSKAITRVLFYSIYDKEAVLQSQAIGVGNTGKIILGGKTDDSIGGKPIEIDCEVVNITNGRFQTFGPMGGGGVWQWFGLSTLLRVNNRIDIIVISNNGQLLDLAQITSMGCDPIRYNIICVKSKHHFRASLSPIAKEIITVDGGGLGSFILKCNSESYKNVRRPIWPLDNIS
eukprot:gene10385-13949_t